jgi:hypothetical protein
LGEEGNEEPGQSESGRGDVDAVPEAAQPRPTLEESQIDDDGSELNDQDE